MRTLKTDPIQMPVAPGGGSHHQSASACANASSSTISTGTPRAVIRLRTALFLTWTTLIIHTFTITIFTTRTNTHRPSPPFEWHLWSRAVKLRLPLRRSLLPPAVTPPCAAKTSSCYLTEARVQTMPGICRTFSKDPLRLLPLWRLKSELKLVPSFCSGVALLSYLTHSSLEGQTGVTLDIQYIPFSPALAPSKFVRWRYVFSDFLWCTMTLKKHKCSFFWWLFRKSGFVVWPITLFIMIDAMINEEMFCHR